MRRSFWPMLTGIIIGLSSATLYVSIAQDSTGEKNDIIKSNKGFNKLERIESLERSVSELRSDVDSLKEQIKARP